MDFGLLTKSIIAVKVRIETRVRKEKYPDVWNAAAYITMSTLIESANGECYAKRQKAANASPADVAANPWEYRTYTCGLSYVMDDDRHSEAMKPKHYFILGVFLFSLNHLVLLVMVFIKCNPFSSQTSGYYIDAMLSAGVFITIRLHFMPSCEVTAHVLTSSVSPSALLLDYYS